jgi:hypothetical protein
VPGPCGSKSQFSDPHSVWRNGRLTWARRERESTLSRHENALQQSAHRQKSYPLLSSELFNKAAEKIFRCSAAQAIGRTLDPFLMDEFRNVIDESFSKSDSNVAGVRIQNLNPEVLMMEPAEDWHRCDATELLRPPKIRSIFIQ